MIEAYKKRLTREKAARKIAEDLLEQKSLELYSKNEELKVLNNELNTKLDTTSTQLTNLSKEHLELFENSGVGVVISMNGHILKINQTFAEMLGYEQEQIVGKDIKEVSYIDDVHASLKITKNLNHNNIQKKVIQKRYKRRNGSFFWASTHVSNIYNTKGETIYQLAIIVNIHKQKITEEKLQTTNKQLREINENLDSFAHIVSHDLRAPLTGINTVLDWMKSKELDDELRNYTDLMQDRVTKMHNLIEGIISYSKAGLINEQKELFSMEKLVDETILLHEIPLNIKIEKTGDFPYVYTNKAKLTQVFSNLIDNALKSNDKTQGCIQISCLEDEKHYTFKIHDNGTGIESKYFSKIFQIFNSLTKDNISSGIGLSLVKKIIEQYGGSISVDSKLGVYTEFTFSILKDSVKI